MQMPGTVYVECAHVGKVFANVSSARNEARKRRNFFDLDDDDGTMGWPSVAPLKIAILQTEN